MGQRGRPRKEQTQKKMMLSVNSEADATFISGPRNYRHVLRAERSWNDEEEVRHVAIGVEVQFADHLASVGDSMHGDEVLMTRDEIVAALLSNKVYGHRFCINESDPTGYWATFKELYGEKFEGLVDIGIKLGLRGDEVQRVTAEARNLGFGRTSSEHSVKQEFSFGKPPTMDGGRDRLSEKQQEAVEAALRI